LHAATTKPKQASDSFTYSSVLIRSNELYDFDLFGSSPARSFVGAGLVYLTVPTLVLWGSSDNYLDRASQDRLMDLLRQASRTNSGMYFYWKQYGVHPATASRNKHEAIDIGHNLSWEAPRQLAADVASFIRTGAPTRDRYRSNAPANIREILVEPGQASIVTSRDSTPVAPR
jgi:pimeloyl-ACP methyl ester carboxylesterase